MPICNMCKNESDKYPYDLNAEVLCSSCDPRSKCIICGEERAKPIGQTEYCMSCSQKQREKDKIVRHGGIHIIDKTKYEGSGTNEAHYKHIQSRAIDADGNTISGQAGIDYMKANPAQYAPRLKEIYK